MLGEDLRIHSVDLLECKQTDFGGKFKRSAVIQVRIVMMMVMMQLELALTMCHFNESLFVNGEGMGGVVTVFSLML